MLPLSNDAVESLLVRAHILQLHALRPDAVTDDERTRVELHASRFEASLLLDAPASVIAGRAAELDRVVGRIEARLRASRTQPRVTRAGWGGAMPQPAGPR